MSKEQEIIRRLREIAKQPLQTFVASVQEVDEEQATITALPVGGPELTDVRLRAAIDGAEDGVILFPEVGSTVLVGIIGNDPDTAFVCRCSVVQKAKLKIGDSTLEISTEGFLMNGGSLGGLINIADLVEKLNAIEQDLNQIKTAFSSWVPVPQDGGAALKTAAGSWAGSTLTQTLQGDLEDTKITH
jgi:hypothetical protein